MRSHELSEAGILFIQNDESTCETFLISFNISPFLSHIYKHTNINAVWLINVLAFILVPRVTCIYLYRVVFEHGCHNTFAHSTGMPVLIDVDVVPDSRMLAQRLELACRLQPANGYSTLYRHSSSESQRPSGYCTLPRRPAAAAAHDSSQWLSLSTAGRRTVLRSCWSFILCVLRDQRSCGKLCCQCKRQIWWKCN